MLEEPHDVSRRPGGLGRGQPIGEHQGYNKHADRARGRQGGRRFALTKAQVRLAQAAMGQKETRVSELCAELGISRTALYRYVGPDGALRENGKRILGVE